MNERLGLISVSGMHVHDDRLAAPELHSPSLGLLTLAAVTPEGFDVRYLEMDAFDEAILRATSFDIVAISSFTAKASVMYALADFYRARR